MNAARDARRGLLLLCIATSTAWGAPPVPGKTGRSAPPAPPAWRSASLIARLDAAAAGSKLLLADSVRCVALRVDFPDLAFGASPPADELHDRFYYENQFRYLSQYFEAASAGRLHVRVDVPDVVVTASLGVAAYGDVAHYDSLMVQLTGEAVRGADARVDFSQYAIVLLVHAGPGQESDVAGDSPTQIWSGFLDEATFREQLSAPDTTVLGIPTDDAVAVQSAIILPEWQVQDLRATGGTRFGSLGVYAHELGQALGLVPLFDASPSPLPDSQGVGNFDLMGYGLWVANGFIPSLPSAFNRKLMGWVDPIAVTGDAEVVLRDIERGPPDSTVLMVPISEREYFLVSYVLEDPDGIHSERPCERGACLETPVTRRFFAFDNQDASCCFGYEDTDQNGVLSQGDRIDSYAGAEWDFFLTDLPGLGTAGDGSGLLILHVDELALGDALAAGSTNVNGDARRKAVDVEEADGIEDLDRFPDNPRAFGSADDYFGLDRAFGPETLPSSHSTNGAPTGIRIELVDLPDATATSPGPRARVRVGFGPTSGHAAAPVKQARRVVDGSSAHDVVALPLADGSAQLVVAADSGVVALLDAGLGGAAAGPRLDAWVVVPEALRGDWIGPPAVGDVDGDGAPDVVAAVHRDSLGAPRSHFFAWDRTGSELYDGDANPGTNTGHLATLEGRARGPILDDFLDVPGREIGAAVEDTAGSGAVVVTSTGARSLFRPPCTSGPEWRLAAGPAALRAPGASLAALAWCSADSARGTARLAAVVPSTSAAACVDLGFLPSRLACGDLDADGVDEIVLAGDDGRLRIARWEPNGLRLTGHGADLGARCISDLALADLDGDGGLEIVLATDAALHVLAFTGAAMRGWPARFDADFGLQREAAPGCGSGSPLVADVDADGRPEILLHLASGPLAVWSADGRRRPEWGAALPAPAGGTPRIAPLGPGGTGVAIAAVGRFRALERFIAPRDSLVTVLRSEFAVWTLPRAGAVPWGEAGGGPGHASRDSSPRRIEPRTNDAALPSFEVGPNPARDRIQARLRLTAPATAVCRVFDLEGEIVAEASRTAGAGALVEFAFDTGRWAPGVFFVQMSLSTGGRRTRPVAIQH